VWYSGWPWFLIRMTVILENCTFSIKYGIIVFPCWPWFLIQMTIGNSRKVHIDFLYGWQFIIIENCSWLCLSIKIHIATYYCLVVTVKSYVGFDKKKKRKKSLFRLLWGVEIFASKHYKIMMTKVLETYAIVYKFQINHNIKGFETSIESFKKQWRVSKRFSDYFDTLLSGRTIAMQTKIYNVFVKQ